MDQDQEFEVIRKVIAGAKNEFRHLVAANQSYVYSLVLKQVANPAVAEELTQEIFIRAYRGLPGFRFQSRFATWVTRIALNQSKTYFRSRRFKERQVEDSYDQQAHEVSKSEPTEDSVVTAQSLERLQQALQLLPQHHREVLVLCALEQKSYEEAAQILGVRVGTVRSRLNRARHQLREIYFKGAE